MSQPSQPGSGALFLQTGMAELALQARCVSGDFGEQFRHQVVHCMNTVEIARYAA